MYRIDIRAWGWYYTLIDIDIPVIHNSVMCVSFQNVATWTILIFIMYRSCIIESMNILIQQVVNTQTKTKIKDDHADPRNWSSTEDKSEKLNIQRTRYVLSLWWIGLWQIIHWPAGDSMIYYMYSLANTISQRAENVMCIWYSTVSTIAQFMYQRTIVCPNNSDIRVTENSLPGRKNLEILWKNLCQYSSLSR